MTHSILPSLEECGLGQEMGPVRGRLGEKRAENIFVAWQIRILPDFKSYFFARKRLRALRDLEIL